MPLPAEYAEILARRFPQDASSPLPVRSPVSLADAVGAHVRPGMHLHLVASHSRTGALSRELMRQFWKKHPRFTLSSTGLVANQVLFVEGDLVETAICSFYGDTYPTPGPNPIVQRGVREGRVRIEKWSILTITQRAMAGALGVPFLPTRSIRGSSMETENIEAGTFFLVDDPARPGEHTGAVAPLTPDITLLHAQAADEHGNLLLTPPYGENVYASYAARLGVVATVEQVLPADVMRERYPAAVKIPGYRVLDFAVVPFGAHPTGLTNQGTPDLPTYADDYEFYRDVRQACRDANALADWVQRWVLDCETQETYLAQLGDDRLAELRRRAEPESWRDDIERLADFLDTSETCTPREMTAIVGARRLRQRIREEQYRTILAGVGVSNLAAWLATVFLADEGVRCTCMAEIGLYGYQPRPADPYIFNFHNLPTCEMLAGIDTIMGLAMGGAQTECIGVLGAGQVDKFGNINSTMLDDATYLVGSGGANDVASAAREVVVTAMQGKNRFVDNVPFITSPGRAVRTLVTDPEKK